MAAAARAFSVWARRLSLRAPESLADSELPASLERLLARDPLADSDDDDEGREPSESEFVALAPSESALATAVALTPSESALAAAAA